jgi:hypothetical protein
MKRVRLRFENIQQIVGADGFSVVILTDEEHRRALSVVCDETATRQILMRRLAPHTCRVLLPEALLQFCKATFELMVFGLHDGQYQVVLSDTDYQQNVRLRMSDAVLLTIIEPSIPLYIEAGLLERQSVPFDPEAKGIAIPINTMDNSRLSEALKHAVEIENYELASQLRDELKRRKEQS